MTPAGALASLIRAQLMRRGWSQDDLSAYTDLPKSTISRLINGQVAHPRPDTLAALARVFDLTIDALYERLGYEHGTKPKVDYVAELAAIDEELELLLDMRDELAQRPDVARQVVSLARYLLDVPAPPAAVPVAGPRTRQSSRTERDRA